MPLPGVLHTYYAWPLRVIHHPHTANFYISMLPRRTEARRVVSIRICKYNSFSINKTTKRRTNTGLCRNSQKRPYLGHEQQRRIIYRNGRKNAGNGPKAAKYGVFHSKAAGDAVLYYVFRVEGGPQNIIETCFANPVNGINKTPPNFPVG